jgi:hypothetical protein
VKVVLITVVGGDAELVDANLAFHLNAGVDFVVATGSGGSDGTAEVLESYERKGYLARLKNATPTEMARLAVAEHGAEWVLPCTSQEFWWPRGESLHDVLSVIPPRYGIVQALVRTFADTRERGGTFYEARTARTSLADGSPTPDEPLRLLRPAYRAEPDMVLDEDDWTLRGRRIPLRAWYPLELLRFPSRGPDPVVEGRVEALAEETLVEDTRLRDALRALREGSSGYALPADGTSPLTLPVPTIVDDAAYAVECAAVGEVDLVRLDREIRELEFRIAALEAQFWPRVRSAVRRLARRPR